ncbi:type 1 glutamine amidotransferase domain-containing protein [Streptomyces sp. TLI_171]|uniref:type 1 glutamine amidotransferase domain-containing protein n=1 Tax=Streptomyces sp. TLI_171 TaxID=1938859 RepID=UPI000C179EB2|nr:type 1 glutamine amidotransferase domain-containing protein [Streptomyces sp. TLI_171]RKE21908.1 putative intracellular protease/amidase [Streptomyces sp. TLI_171]
MSKILFVMTGADHWTLKDGTPHPTGYWAEEVATPYRALRDAGHEIAVATPGGVVPPVDRGSLEPGANGGAEQAREVADTLAAMTELQHPLAIADVDLADWDAVLYPGGHGPMEDLSADADSGRLLTLALASAKPLAVVCHGSAALLAAVDQTGRNTFAGRRVAAFTDEEETLAGLADRAKWLLESRLTEAGLTVDTAAPWTPHVVVDGSLITGQNPASSGLLADELIKQLA